MSRKSLRIGKQSAAALCSLLLRHGAECNEFLKAQEASMPKDEYDALKQLVGKAMGEIYVGCLYPVFEQYPELKPIGLK